MERLESTSFSDHVESARRRQTADRSPDAAVRKTTCVVEFRSGEAVHRHPELKRYFAEGWEIRSAAPYLGDADCVQLMVILERCPAQS